MKTMKTVFIKCDRCSQQINTDSDQQITDFFQQEYPGKDICQDCDLTITLAQAAVKADTISGEKPGSSLKKLLSRYQH